MTQRRLRAAPLAAVFLFFVANVSFAHDAQDSASAIVPRRDASLLLEPVALGATGADFQSARPEVGTKDAPVDGMDGKPHAGPFVDTVDHGRHAPNIQTGDDISDERLLRQGEKTIAEDGVMNDPHRLPPKKGTTGTEGGVSELDRDRRIHEFSTGERIAKVPNQPKSSPALDARSETAEVAADPRKATGTVAARTKAVEDNAKGFAGLEVGLVCQQQLRLR